MISFANALQKYLERFTNTLLVRLVGYGFLLLAASSIVYLSLVNFRAPGINSLDLQVGKVAPQDILAPYGLSYESEVLTNQQKDITAQAVTAIYSSPSTQIARQQVDELRAILGFLTTVRDDPDQTTANKLADIALLENYSIPPETAEYILQIPESQWQSIQQETILVLQQVMRFPIREGSVEDAIRNVPGYVSLTLSEEQSTTTAQLVNLFVVPNSFYNEELTQARRQAARDAVRPVAVSYLRGETLLPRGKVITAADVEALRKYDMLADEDGNQRFLAAFSLVSFLAALSTLYIYTQNNSLATNEKLGFRRLLYTAVFLVLFLVSARLFILGHTVLPYLFPAAGFGMLAASLFGFHFGMFMSIPLALLITFESPNGLELSFYYIACSFVGIMTLGKARRITHFFWAGLAIAVGGGTVILAYRLLDPFTDLTGIFTLMAAALINGFVSAGLVILIQYITAHFLGLITPLQLVDLSRPDQPLLRHLLTISPGTYQHSLQVANLSEQAAESIGADALLTKVGALYHDVGKTKNPQFFIENQIPGHPNPHDSLMPETSASIIIRHVTDGVELARKYRIPDRMIDFIREHHGTMITQYQYTMARNQADSTGEDPDNIDTSRFTYPGPKPRSRETALVLLADGCEARARAERPQAEEEIRKLVKETIDNRLDIGQLDDTTLTTRDLNFIVESFTATLRGIYHPRLAYPSLTTKNKEESALPNMPEKQSAGLLQDTEGLSQIEGESEEIAEVNSVASLTDVVYSETPISSEEQPTMAEIKIDDSPAS